MLQTFQLIQIFLQVNLFLAFFPCLFDLVDLVLNGISLFLFCRNFSIYSINLVVDRVNLRIVGIFSSIFLRIIGINSRVFHLLILVCLFVHELDDPVHYVLVFGFQALEIFMFVFLELVNVFLTVFEVFFV